MAEPVRVRDLLARLPGVADCLAEARLLAAWPEVAGPASARTRAQEIEDGVLHVAVESSGWLHRLTLEEPALLAQCRTLAPRVALRGIRFHLASLAPPSNAVEANAMIDADLARGRADRPGPASRRGEREVS